MQSEVPRTSAILVQQQQQQTHTGISRYLELSLCQILLAKRLQLSCAEAEGGPRPFTPYFAICLSNLAVIFGVIPTIVRLEFGEGWYIDIVFAIRCGLAVESTSRLLTLKISVSPGSYELLQPIRI